MATSVLRVADQRKGRLPDRCVVSGAPTNRAVRVWAARRPRWRALYPLVRPLRYLLAGGRPPRALAVALPVAPAAWHQRRNVLAATGVAGGIAGALVAIGATGQPGLLVAGLVLGVIVVAAQVRFNRRHWVRVWLKDDGEEIIVTNTSAPFDDQARQLFIRRLPG